jgi:hypothetical protein
MINYRNIPEPLGEIRVRVTLGRPPRFSRPFDYVKTDHSFMVELVFNSDLDLAMFEKVIQGSTLRFYEYPGSPSRIFVTDDRLPRPCTRTEIDRWVDLELHRINAAVGLRCPGYLGARCRSVVELFPDGRSGPSTESERFSPPPMDMDQEWNSIRALGGPLLDDYLEKVEADPDFAEAMALMGQALAIEGAQPWSNLYRAYEIIAQHVGGKHKLSSRGWCTQDELSLFTRTVNHQKAIGSFSRHARQKGDPPPTPMRFREAKRFVLRLVQSWLDENSTVKPSSPSTTLPVAE